MEIVEKDVNYGGKHYRRTIHNGYFVLHEIKDGVVDESVSIPEHRLVYEISYGVTLPDEIHIHHLNRDRTDNRIQNLIALNNRDHARLHAFEDGVGEIKDSDNATKVLPIDRVSSIPKSILEKFVAYNGVVFYRTVMNNRYYITPVIDGCLDINNRVNEAKYVYEITHAVKLDDGIRIYHLNGDTYDNRPENLAITNNGEYVRLASSRRKKTDDPSDLYGDVQECLITRETLEDLIRRHTNSEIGSMYGVSGTAVAGWRKRLGLPTVSEMREVYKESDGK